MKEIKRFIFLIFGILFLILGFVGLILPIIPGIPFFLIGILFTAKGSKKFLKVIIKNKFIGKYFQSIRKNGLSKKTKGITLVTIWITHLISIIFIKIIVIKMFLLFSLFMVTWILFILKSKETIKKNTLILSKEI